MLKYFRLNLSVLLLLALPSAAAESVHYSLNFQEPQTHYTEVEMTVRDWKGGEMDLRLPVWTPGSYMVREFSRHLESFSAFSGKNKIPYQRSAGNGWKINAPAGDVLIKYKVYAFELTVRTSFIDADHAYLNGTSIFLYAENGKNWPVTVTVNLPQNWKTISVALEKTGKSNTFKADNYDLLADSPFEIGNHEVIRFTAAGVPHEIAIFGEGNHDPEKLKKDISRIVDECTAIFGSHPCKQYLFIVHNLSSGGGGLEHLNSTTIQTNRFTYGNESAYFGFLSLVAHEYFHLWNVKRLRPVELGPFDYNNENYTTLLWFVEGFTSYYDDLIVKRCGFYSTENYLAALSGSLSYVMNTPGSKVQTLEESSYDAWIKYYKPHENSANTSVSYYTKGSVIGAMLDFAIREATEGKKSLDDLMKLMYQRYWIDNKGAAGFTDKDLMKAVNEISGINMDDFFNRYVAGTDSIPYGQYVAALGLKVTDQNAKKKTPWTGINTSVKEGKLTITSAERNGPGWKYGLNANDEIIALNQYRVADDYSRLIAQFAIGDTVEFTVSRMGILRKIPVVIGTAPHVKLILEPDTEATAAARENFRSWLESRKP